MEPIVRVDIEYRGSRFDSNRKSYNVVDVIELYSLL